MLKQKARKVGKSIVVTIPKPICEYFDIEEGNIIHFDIKKVEKKKK